MAAKLSGEGKRASLAFDPDLGDDDLSDDRILGGGDFVGRVLNLAGQAAGGPKRSFAEIIDQVATYFSLEKSRLKKPGKERVLAQAKAVICYVAVREQGLRGVDISPALAYTPAAVSHAAKRGEDILRQEKDLQTMLGMNL